VTVQILLPIGSQPFLSQPKKFLASLMKVVFSSTIELLASCPKATFHSQLLRRSLMAGNSDSTIKVAADITIDGFKVTDSNVVSAFKAVVAEGESTAEYLENIIVLGSKVLGLANAGAGVQKLADGIEDAGKVMKEASRKLSEEINEKVDAITGDDGKLAKLIDSQIEEFVEQLEGLTGGEDSPIRKGIKKQMDEMSKKLVDDFVRQTNEQKAQIAKLLDIQDPTSPLRSLGEKLESVSSDVKEIHTEIAKSEAIAEIVEATPVGGNNYEDVAVKALQLIAGRAGDVCVSTGSVTGRISRSKKGDATVDLKVGGSTYARIVMEAKNSPLSLLEWEREAVGSKDNRAATGFIGMCKYEKDMPNNGRILIIDSQTIVVACDPEKDDAELFALVYQVVKMNTLSTAGSLDGLNLAEVNKNLADAISALTKFDSITKQVSAIKNSADAIFREANSIREGVTLMIESVQKSIQRTLEPEALESAARLALESNDADE
jgi:polyhydroxyalkanoate synthesis regulator phasin